jgi:hypothetical protein
MRKRFRIAGTAAVLLALAALVCYSLLAVWSVETSAANVAFGSGIALISGANSGSLSADVPKWDADLTGPHSPRNVNVAVTVSTSGADTTFTIVETVALAVGDRLDADLLSGQVINDGDDFAAALSGYPHLDSVSVADQTQAYTSYGDFSFSAPVLSGRSSPTEHIFTSTGSDQCPSDLCNGTTVIALQLGPGSFDGVLSKQKDTMWQLSLTAPGWSIVGVNPTALSRSRTEHDATLGAATSIPRTEIDLSQDQPGARLAAAAAVANPTDTTALPTVISSGAETRASVLGLAIIVCALLAGARRARRMTGGLRSLRGPVWLVIAVSLGLYCANNWVYFHWNPDPDELSSFDVFLAVAALVWWVALLPYVAVSTGLSGIRAGVRTGTGNRASFVSPALSRFVRLDIAVLVLLTAYQLGLQVSAVYMLQIAALTLLGTIGVALASLRLGHREWLGVSVAAALLAYCGVSMVAIIALGLFDPGSIWLIVAAMAALGSLWIPMAARLLTEAGIATGGVAVLISALPLASLYLPAISLMMSGTGNYLGNIDVSIFGPLLEMTFVATDAFGCLLLLAAIGWLRRQGGSAQAVGDRRVTFVALFLVAGTVDPIIGWFDVAVTDIVAIIVALLSFGLVISGPERRHAVTLAGMSARFHGTLLRKQLRERLLRNVRGRLLRSAGNDLTEGKISVAEFDARLVDLENESAPGRVSSLRGSLTNSAPRGNGAGYTPWQNGLAGAGAALIVSVPLVLYELYGYHSLYFGLYGAQTLSIVRHSVRWVAYGFFYGFFYTRIRGSEPIRKALFLMLAIIPPELLLLMHIQTQYTTPTHIGIAILIRVGEILAFCIVLGLVWERRMTSAAGLPWMVVRDFRQASALAAPATAVLVAAATTVSTALAGAAIASILHGTVQAK